METELELTLPQALQLALRMLREDHPEVAEHVYMSVLAQHPEQPDALHYLGFLKHRRGQREVGVELMRRSIERAPDQPWMWNNLGNILVEQERLEEGLLAYQQCLALNPKAADALGNLGSLYRKWGRMEEAEQACRQAVALQPDLAMSWFQLARVLIERGNLHEGLVANSKGIVLAPHDQTGRSRVARALVLLGEVEKAAAVYREWLADEPDNAMVKHHLAACEGDNRQLRAPDGYVEQVFDGFAPSFDAKLESLGYRAPQLIAGLLARLCPEPTGELDVADIGCGTGLCGPLVRRWARRLVGCDLSTGMLRLAAERGVYDELEKSELVAYLRLHPAKFDLVISADTLCYFGDLHDVARAAFAALRIGGRLVFTVEALTDERSERAGDAERSKQVGDAGCADEADRAAGGASADNAASSNGRNRPGADRPAADRPAADRPGADRLGADRPDPGDTYRLLLHGRYAHSRDYVERVLRDAGLVVEDLNQELLRYESGLPVRGWLVGAVKSEEKAELPHCSTLNRDLH